MIKIAIIGAGNMGSAIAKSLGDSEEYELIVSNRSQSKLDILREEYEKINITSNNNEAIKKADVVILAVKPWLMKGVVEKLDLSSKQIIISVAAGISLEELFSFTSNIGFVYRVMPNTAISVKESVNLISTDCKIEEKNELVFNIFDKLGTAIFIPEEKMDSATSLASCGIAYVMKYIQAAMQAGIEMGISPKDAQLMVSQCVLGAGKILLDSKLHPSSEIDKVTTPGGLTIKGINTLEYEGFSAAIIKALKASTNN